MTDARSNLRRLTGTLSHLPVTGSTRDEIARQYVHRVKDAGPTFDSWEKRILELSDGKCVADLMETLYRDELKGGAWVADIVLWRDLFDRSVINTIRQLAGSGYLSLRAEDNS